MLLAPAAAGQEATGAGAATAFLRLCTRGGRRPRIPAGMTFTRRELLPALAEPLARARAHARLSGRVVVHPSWAQVMAA